MPPGQRRRGRLARAQIASRALERFAQAPRGFAGRRDEHHPRQGPPRRQRLFDEQRENLRHRMRLARPRSSRDDADAPYDRSQRSHPLPVGRVRGGRIEEPSEALPQYIGVDVGPHLAGTPKDLAREPPLMVPVPAEVETIPAIQDERRWLRRRRRGAFRDELARAEGGEPEPSVGPSSVDERPPLLVDERGRVLEVETDVALRDLSTHQSGRQQHFLPALTADPFQRPRKVQVERRQEAAATELFEGRDHVAPSARWFGVKIADSSATSAGEGRSWNTP